jgi:hypothetical protein
MPKEYINEKPFTYIARYGTLFASSRCDLKEGVDISTDGPNPISLQQYHSDLAEMIGYHATVVHSQLNGFQGYDCISFKFLNLMFKEPNGTKNWRQN